MGGSRVYYAVKVEKIAYSRLPMTRSSWTNRIIFGLAILALIQVGILATRSAPRGSPASAWLEAGDSLGPLQPLDAQGRVVSLSGHEPTVLLVFHSECEYCQGVASLWKSWKASRSDSARVVFLSGEPRARAEVYATRQEWGSAVWTMEPGAEEGLGKALLQRTPWVFVLGADGVILAEGHGGRIREITEILDTMRAEGP